MSRKKSKPLFYLFDHIINLEGETVTKCKVYICAAIFVALTIIKMFIPQLSNNIVSEMKTVFNIEQRQMQSVLAIGSALTSGDALSAFTKHEAQTAKSDAVDERAEAISYGNALQVEMPTEEETKKAAFLKSQEAYSDYAVPQNVSYDIISIEFDYAAPIDGVTSSGFGYRMHPIKNEVKFHYGTDFAASEGTEIHAFADGTVIAAGYDEGYGYYIVMSHENDFRTLYAHCSKLCVGCQSVEKGEVIALVGQSGSATGAHLHFELQADGVYLNPEFYI